MLLKLMTRFSVRKIMLEGTSMGRSCAYTTVENITVLNVGELVYVFTRRANMIVHCANQAGKARLTLVKAAAWAVGA